MCGQSGILYMRHHSSIQSSENFRFWISRLGGIQPIQASELECLLHKLDTARVINNRTEQMQYPKTKEGGHSLYFSPSKYEIF